MRGFLIGCLAAAFVAIAPAQAQTTIVLHANPIPIVDASINGRPVRLEVDLRLPDGLVLNPAVAQRLGVHNIPFVSVAIGVDGGTTRVHGRLARPRVLFGAAASRSFAGIFAVPATSRADGVIGPGSLPYDVVTVELGPEPATARDIALPIENADLWTAHSPVGGLDLEVEFDLAHPESVFSLTAARQFDAQGLITSDGDLIDKEVILGLTTKVQPVRTALAALGLALAPTLARTNEPLRGAVDPDSVEIVVTPHAPPPPKLTIGRAALANCSSISVNRSTRRMILRCAN